MAARPSMRRVGAWYMAVVSLIGLSAMILLPETAPRKRGNMDAAPLASAGREG